MSPLLTLGLIRYLAARHKNNNLDLIQSLFLFDLTCLNKYTTATHGVDSWHGPTWVLFDSVAMFK
jgi:hypothetical protein